MPLESYSTCLMNCQSSLLPKKPRFLNQKMWAPRLAIVYLISLTLGEFLDFSESLPIRQCWCSLFFVLYKCDLTFIKCPVLNCAVINKSMILFLSAKPGEAEESRKKWIHTWNFILQLRECLATYVPLPWVRLPESRSRIKVPKSELGVCVLTHVLLTVHSPS